MRRAWGGHEDRAEEMRRTVVARIGRNMQSGVSLHQKFPPFKHYLIHSLGYWSVQDIQCEMLISSVYIVIVPLILAQHCVALCLSGDAGLGSMCGGLILQGCFRILCWKQLSMKQKLLWQMSSFINWRLQNNQETVNIWRLQVLMLYSFPFPLWILNKNVSIYNGLQNITQKCKKKKCNVKQQKMS